MITHHCSRRTIIPLIVGHTLNLIVEDSPFSSSLSSSTSGRDDMKHWKKSCPTSSECAFSTNSLITLFLCLEAFSISLSTSWRVIDCISCVIPYPNLVTRNPEGFLLFSTVQHPSSLSFVQVFLRVFSFTPSSQIAVPLAICLSVALTFIVCTTPSIVFQPIFYFICIGYISWVQKYNVLFTLAIVK